VVRLSQELLGSLVCEVCVYQRMREPWLLALAVVAAIVVAATAPVQTSGLGAKGTPRFKAVAFDYFVLFNADSVLPEVERAFPGKGREFTNLWRTRKFEYGWLRSITNRYEDFLTITEDALVYTAHTMHLELAEDTRRRLLDAYLHLTPWPDTVDALRTLRASGVRVIAVANFSPKMLRSNAEHAGILDLFDALVSTDAAHTYKPDPRAYQLGIYRLQLAKTDIVFAAFGGWDAAGAKAFGYPTVRVNRFNVPPEELGIRADQTAPDMNGLLAFVFGESPTPRTASR
jgi:2-haloacid dehalogenase